MSEKAVCMEHSGCVARIKACENDIVNIFERLWGLEKEVWKAAGASGVITGIVTAVVIAILEKVIK